MKDNAFLTPQDFITPAQTVSTGKFGSTSKSLSEAREIAAIQGKIFMARQFPRDMEEVKKKIQASCSRPSLASGAVYQYARQGTTVTGPSIRLAEVLSLAFGNIESSTEVLDQDDERSIVKVWAWDYESNRQSSRTFVVRHERDTRGGKKKLSDNRDIMEQINNIAARNRRACILELIPIDYQELALNTCEQTLKSNVTLTQNTINDMLDAFKNNFGVTRGQIEKRIQSNAESISIGKFLELRRIYASINDGVGKIEDFFEPEEKEELPKADSAVQKGRKNASQANLKEKLGKVAEAPQPQPEPEPEIETGLEADDDLFALSMEEEGFDDPVF